MSSKRRKSIKKEGQRRFIPDCEPCYTYSGKELIGSYDRKCFLEGWMEARNEHYEALRIEAEMRDSYESI